MKEVAKLSIKDRTELFQATAISLGMQPNVIEKDFWVCFMLDHLFHDCKYKDAFVFKGGTSLSKSYHVIERFSENIDLIYPAIFMQKETSVLTIDVERTFWEKLTILHKIAHFPEGKVLPSRYARHLYDVCK